ncbi:oligosaccharide flippase family protein [Nitratireductor sp. GCM10026969]|uniref:oligosaccharide flippase family protein n=1 Tax=Nitratireductor sp. GCM10026969 TaxID=3252645 RepID=UPI00360E2936
MINARRLIGQAAWASCGQLAQTLLATINLIVLVRILGAEAYGIFALGLLFTGLAEVLIGGHAADIIVQRKDARSGHRNAAFNAILVVSFASTVLIVLASSAAAHMFDIPQLRDLLLGMSVLPLLTGLASVPNQILVRRLQFGALAKIGTISAVLAVATGVTLASFGAGVWSLAIMEIARRSASLVMVFAAARWWPRLHYTRSELIETVRFAMRRVENRGLSYLSQTGLPRVFIGQMLGAEALGYFTVARRLLDQLHAVLSGPVAAVAFPAISRLKVDSGRLSTLISSAIRLTTWVFWPAVLGIIVIAPVLMPVAFGEEWVQATPVLQLLAIGSLRTPVSSFNTAILVAFGELRAVSLISILSIAFCAVALAIGANFGMSGVAAALALRQWVLWPVGATLVYRVTGFPPIRQLTVLMVAATPSLIMAVCIYAIQRATDLAPWHALVLEVFAGVVIYAVAWSTLNRTSARQAWLAVGDLVSGDLTAAKARLDAMLSTASSISK